MIIGCPKEIKKHEYRVGLTPHDVKAYKSRGCELFIQKGAGEGSGYDDSLYREAGARILDSAKEVWEKSEMIVKVKEPLQEEFRFFREGLVIFTYFHLAAAKELAAELIKRKVTAVAYETIELPDHSLPCLTPMSEIAGRLSVQEGAKYLEKEFGGRGILLGGVPGVERGTVGILGAGIVGTNACKIASGIGASVYVLDINPKRLAYLDDIFGSRITTLYATEANIDLIVSQSDILIGAVLIPGESAPKLIKREHLTLMKKGAVIVDVAIDQGGCSETSKPTTHDDPIYIVDGVVHYCVANMPGAVAYTSTKALTSVTLPFGLSIATKGIKKAASDDPAIKRGVNTINGKCVHDGVARSCGFEYEEFKS
jgi:alanine dehydrogenase